MFENDPVVINLCEQYQASRKINKKLSTGDKSALKLPLTVPHCLLSGPAGVGKTSRVEAFVKSVGKELIYIGPDVEGIEEFINIFYDQLSWRGYKTNFGRCLNSQRPTGVGEYIIDPINPIGELDNKFVFIDEIHLMGDDLQERLGLIMLNWRYTLDNETIWFPRFTVIGATTRPGLLKESLLSRFTTPFSLDFYTETELQEICQVMLKERNLKADQESLTLLARASQGVARACENLISRLYLHTVGSGKELCGATTLSFLSSIGVNQDGLNRMQLKTLKTLKNHRSLGLLRLSFLLGVDQETFMRDIEPCLASRGLISQGRGREITDKGREYLEKI